MTVNVWTENEVLKLVELLSKQVLMRITGRMEKTGDKIYFLGRVIERTARGYSVEANPKYIRNVINVLGLEEAKPVMTPSVKRTPTTESLVELEGERRAMYRTVVGKLLYMCQERADVMYSVKETARKITCPTESEEMNLKRIVRYLKGAPSAKSLIEIITPSKFVNVYTDSDWAKTSYNVQEHKWRGCAVRKCNTHSMVKNTANSKFEFY